jgi:hypothetical protein
LNFAIPTRTEDFWYSGPLLVSAPLGTIRGSRPNLNLGLRMVAPDKLPETPEAPPYCL